jgi:phosphatidylglycerophosphatase A
VPTVNPRKWIVTFFGSGLSPLAPGTAGSLATAAIFYGINLSDPPRWAWQTFLLAGLVVACILMVALGPWAVAHFGREDPQPVVLDEVAGMCLTTLLLPMRGPHGIVTVLAALAAFRLFDVTKPPPARQLERLPAGWGILCDDLAAAVYANALCQLALRLLG